MTFVIIKAYNGGGMFSVFDNILDNVANSFQGRYDTINGFKILIPKGHYIKDEHFFDALFDYTNIEENPIILEPRHLGFRLAYSSPHYNAMRTILFKNKINPTIHSSIEAYKQQFQINENTLAIHMRLTDMNTIHGVVHGVRTFDDFCNKLNQLVQKNPNIDSIYVCSDNSESIQKLCNIYSSKYKIHYIKDTVRVAKENINSMSTVIDQYNTEPNMATDLFTELLIASSCSYFIYRKSSFANLAILYSNTFKVVECIN